jgi:hypothetical protein
MTMGHIRGKLYGGIPHPEGTARERKDDWRLNRPITWQYPRTIGSIVVPEAMLTVAQRGLAVVSYGPVGTVWDAHPISNDRRTERAQRNAIISPEGLTIVDRSTELFERIVRKDLLRIGVTVPPDDQLELEIKGGNYVDSSTDPTDRTLHTDGMLPQVRYLATLIGQPTAFASTPLRREQVDAYLVEGQEADQRFALGSITRFCERTPHRGPDALPDGTINPRLTMSATAPYDR